MEQLPSLEECFYGSVTVGERGQIVIPAEARKAFDFQPGDKLLVFRHPGHPKMLLLTKVGEMQQLLEQIAQTLEDAKDHIAGVLASDEDRE